MSKGLKLHHTTTDRSSRAALGQNSMSKIWSTSMKFPCFLSNFCRILPSFLKLKTHGSYSWKLSLLDDKKVHNQVKEKLSNGRIIIQVLLYLSRTHTPGRVTLKNLLAWLILCFVGKIKMGISSLLFFLHTPIAAEGAMVKNNNLSSASVLTWLWFTHKDRRQSFCEAMDFSLLAGSAVSIEL